LEKKLRDTLDIGLRTQVCLNLIVWGYVIVHMRTTHFSESTELAVILYSTNLSWDPKNRYAQLNNWLGLQLH